MGNETWEDRDGRKKMSKNNAKSMGAMRQKLRKYIKDFEGDIKKFKENPDAADFDEPEKADEEQEDEDEPVVPDTNMFKKKQKSATPADDDDDDDDSDDSYWDDSESESSSSSDEMKGVSLRERFLKKKVDDFKKDGREEEG